MVSLLVTLGLAAAGASVFAVRLGALARAARRTDPAPARMPSVSVIVPARNEADNLPALLASLAKLEPRPLEIIVVDDHSTDDTGDLARAAGAKVVVPGPLPPGWIGKPWACAAGAAAARGELYLFTDADTIHAPDSLGRTVARLEATGADLVSVVPRHLAVSRWEKCQGAFQLLLFIATRAGAARPGPGERDFAIGQYLLFRRAAYERLGGHRFVRGRVAEDLCFQQAIRARGGIYALVAWPGTMAVRMYPEGLRGFLRGWRRNFREGLRSAGGGGVFEIGLVFAWLGGLPIAFLQQLLAGQRVAAALLGVAMAATVAEVARRQKLVGPLPWWGALAFPLMLVAFCAVTLLAAFDNLRRAPVVWRGRVIPQDQLEEQA
jgi:4,4'-diaponeurosporenoate glycosyltransferase